MVVTKTKRVAYLRRYLNSNGVELPPDSDDFKSESLYARECLFCTEPHSGIPIYRYEPVEQTQKASDCHMCNECSLLVTEMVRREYPQLYKESVDAGKAVDFEEGDWGNRRYKLNLYNTTQEFDHTVEFYFIHKAEHNLKCYFCGGKAVSVDPELLVPRNDSHKLSGGKVKVCSDKCYSELWDDAKDDNTNHPHIDQKCSYCSALYLVTREEFEREHITGTAGRHMCPECVWQGLLKEEKAGSVLADVTNKDDPTFRFLHKECEVCSAYHTIDLTLLHSKLRAVHEIEVGDVKKERCLLCYQFKISDIRVKQVYSVASLYCVLIYQDKYWIYRLSKVVNNEERVMFRPPTDYRVVELLTCIADAYEAASTLGQQMEIEYG